MPQNDPWDAFPVVSTTAAPAATAYPGVIPGRPKGIDPAEAERLRMQEDSNAREAERLRIAQQDQERQQAQFEGTAGIGTQSQQQIATLLTRIAGGASDIQDVIKTDPAAAAPGFVENLRGDLMPGGIGGMIARGVAGSDRRTVADSQRDMLDAMLTLGTGAAYAKEQLTGQMAAYFPQYNDDPKEIAVKNRKLLRLIEAAKANAGPAWAKVEPAIAPLMQSLSQANGNDKGQTPLIVAGQQVFDANGNPVGPDFNGEGFDKSGQSLGLFGRTTDESLTPEQQAARAEADRLNKQTGELGVGDLAKQGMTLGLTDEASGIGTAIGRALKGDINNFGKNYAVGRDAQELRLNDARQRLGYAGNIAEFVGGAALPAGVLSRAGGGLSLGRAATEGAAIGALGGFGYGRGVEGSAINAAGGAVLGGSLGYAGQRVGNALANRAALRANPDVVAAGQAEGVTVNRAMVDPNSNNRVTKTDASLIGGRRIQRDMGNIEGQVQGRVEALGAGGQPMDAVALGDKVKAAGERFIDKSGKAAKVKYDRAEKLAGDAKVTPQESLRRVDEMIGELGGAKPTGLLDANGNPIVRSVEGSGLSETPKTNSNEIAFLQEIKGDLTNDLSVGGLRRMRTKLRQKISKGDLTFGEDEARVLSIMDGAANDIEAGLTAQGKGDAAQAFRAADTAYKARMEYISGTVQKLLGKRNATLSAEQIAGKFNSMAKSDTRGLRKFYATLNPQEQADVAATFADKLGTNNKDGFTVSQFLRQTSSKNLSDQAAETIFGPQGAQSIKNLRVLGKEIERVTGAMNSRTSKSGVANYRDWVFSFLAGGGAGGVSGSLPTMGATAAAGVGIKAGMDMLSARALMSPKLTRWFLNAPKTTDAAAIDRHFNQLGEIAKAEPVIAGEIESLRKAILGAANDNASAGSLAAQDQNTEKRDRKPN